MKKHLLAVAVAAVLSSPVMAAVNIDTNTGAVSYASELVVPGTTPLTGAAIDVTATTGFGVVNGQTRFVRFQLTNGTFATNAANTNLTVAGVAAGDITIVQGGGLGDDFVVYQVQATANVSQSAAVGFALGTIGVVPDSATDPVQVRYSLYSDAPSAAAGGAGGLLNTTNNNNATVANLVTGLAYSVTPTSATADVSATTGAYTKFLSAVTTVKLADVSLGAATGVLDPSTGAQVAYGTLVGAATALQLTASNSIASLGGVAGTGDVFVAANCGAAPTASDTNASRTGTSTVITTGTTALAAAALCYAVPAGGSAVAIPTQDFTLAVDVAPAVGSTAADLAAVASGSFARNGTILKAAFAEGSTVSGTSSAISLTNTSALAAPFTTSCLTGTGRVAGNGGTVAANSGTRFGITSAAGLGCPTATRGIELTFAVPTGSVIGSVVRQNVTTGTAGFDGMVGNQ